MVASCNLLYGLQNSEITFGKISVGSEEFFVQLLTDSSRPLWEPYEVGDVYSFENVFYRRFSCPAGSVHLHIKKAAESSSFPRSIFLTGQLIDGSTVAELVVDSTTRRIDTGSLLRTK